MAETILLDVPFSVPRKVVDESIERALASYSADALPVQRDWLRGKVNAAHDSIRETVKPENEAVVDAGATLEKLIRARGALRGRWGWLRLLLGLLSLAAILVGLWALFRWTWPVHYLDFQQAFGMSRQAGITWTLAAGGFLLSTVVLLAVLRRQTYAPLIEAARSDLVTKHARRTEAIRVHIQEFVRAAISTQVSQEQSSGALLYETDSSGLVETTAPLVIGSENVDEVEQFVHDHSTSAIGIAGPRGCGKTTIITRLTAPRESVLGVYIQAPVYYEAADFVRLIHAEIAKKILRRRDVDEVMLDRRAARYGHLIRFLTGGSLALLGVGVVLLGSRQAPSWMLNNAFGTAGIALVAIGLYLMAAVYLRAFVPRSPRIPAGADTPLIQLASDELRSLRWKTSLQAKDKSSVKLLPAFTLDSEDQVGLDQRERSHPERVGDLRDFLLKLRDYQNFPPVLVGIDELDKIASAEKAVDAVNGLKDLFHITDTHFVVSVSEDALDSFALRGVPVRDVFDSSFDTVMRIRPFTAAESWQLIGRRAPLFNEWASLLCHVIAGGLPRDLIRAARRCVDLCRANRNPLPMATLTAQLVREEASEVIEAAIRRTRSNGSPSVWLMAARRRLEGSPGLGAMSPDTLFADWRPAKVSADDDSAAAKAASALTDVEANVGVFLLIMGTAAELFGVPRSPAQWREFADASTAQLECLAAARAAMGVSRIDALGRLADARMGLGLPDLPIELVDRLNTVVAATQPEAAAVT
ncbi:hypothetical protein ACIA5D_39835 [Actinoplanes sp. NPDC051513]|uniref:hypothetical protein n=1 Tax=Actinoplanes sp. NPDC051513 TaxID=3363908 RepID=UPI0037A926C8